MLVTFYQTTWHNNPEDYHLQIVWLIDEFTVNSTAVVMYNYLLIK
jgi:hypothetical protein